MPQSLSSVILHIIFSTKNREPWLDPNVRPRMNAYLATISRDLGAELVHIGGAADHVHVVTTLPRTLSQAQLVEKIKKASSKWIKSLGGHYRGFFWQRGYGAFSVSPSQLDAVLRYITPNKSTIARGRFRKNTGSCCANMASNLTSAMSGNEPSEATDSRFQRLVFGKRFPGGVAPGSK